MDRPTAHLPCRARRNWRACRAAAAGVLACALIFFTTAYRHSNAFSPATAARIHALSADPTDARTLFAGASGPLAAIAVAAGTPPARPAACRVPSAPEPVTGRLLALVVSSPRYRPPPIAL